MSKIMQGKKIRILWVDDEQSILNVMQTLLSKVGYDVTTTVSASEALELLERDSYDLVGTNIRMPVMNGLDLARLIKDQYPNMAVVILTGSSGKEYRKMATDIGVDAFLSKPFKVEELFNTLKQFSGTARK